MMCGIAAVFKFREPVNPALVDKALDAMRHRGPDGRGYEILDGGRVALMHTRLAVTGVENGRQPLSDDTVCITVNGEFYDDGALRRRLEQMGYFFSTESDSELALHLYRAYDLDFVNYLVGEFALVLWDGRKRRLVAARDRFGIKPLYVCDTGAGVYFASQVKTLFAMGVDCQWSRDGLLSAVSHQYLAAQASLFHNIHRLPPAGIYLVDDSGSRCFEYWRANYDEAGDGDTIRLHQTLRLAVRQRLRTSVPVAFSLSAGIDSSLVAAMAARLSGKPVAAFTISFDPPHDEFPQVRNDWINAPYPVQLHRVGVAAADIMRYFEDAVYFGESMAINGQLVAKYLLAKAIREAGYKVVLSGEGADEAFLGYAHLMLDHYGSQPRRSKRLLSDFQGNLQQGIMLPPEVETGNRTGQWLPAFVAAKRAIGDRHARFLSPAMERAVTSNRMFQSWWRGMQERLWAIENPVKRAAYAWTRTALCNYILGVLGDGMEMAHGIEGRLPFLDHRVFELAASLPVRNNIRFGQGKLVLRRLARNYLPKQICRRPKQPLIAPLLFGNRRLRMQIRERLMDRETRLVFYDYEKIRPWLDSLAAAQPNSAVTAMDDVILMSIWSATALQRHFNPGSRYL